MVYHTVTRETCSTSSKPVNPALHKEDSRTLIVTCNFHVCLCALDYLSASIVPFSYKFQLHFLCEVSTIYAMPLFFMIYRFSVTESPCACRAVNPALQYSTPQKVKK